MAHHSSLPPVFLAVIAFQLLLLLAATSAFPTTTVAPTMAGAAAATTSPISVYDQYDLLLHDTNALFTQFQAVYLSFKTQRFEQTDVMAPELVINGFLTTRDLPSTHTQQVSEEELLQSHQQFLRTYERVLESLIDQENIVVGGDSPFVDDYTQIVHTINRLLVKIDGLMQHQDIENGPDPTFTSLDWLPGNSQVHNVRSLYLLHNVYNYIPASMQHYSYLKMQHTPSS
ncbi:uncharacterized protein [Diadema antillarum]|uniref:uncharacterized protein n=1 Tax=Diadema antillarum TaxID=105358 RepID=UPI003A885860